MRTEKRGYKLEQMVARVATEVMEATVKMARTDLQQKMAAMAAMVGWLHLVHKEEKAAKLRSKSMRMRWIFLCW